MSVMPEKAPPQPSPQGGGGVTAVPACLAWGEAVPQIVSPLVGEMAGRPEGVFCGSNGGSYV